MVSPPQKKKKKTPKETEKSEESRLMGGLRNQERVEVHPGLFRMARGYPPEGKPRLPEDSRDPRDSYRHQEALTCVRVWRGKAMGIPQRMC